MCVHVNVRVLVWCVEDGWRSVSAGVFVRSWLTVHKLLRTIARERALSRTDT